MSGENTAPFFFFKTHQDRLAHHQHWAFDQLAVGGEQFFHFKLAQTVNLLFAECAVALARCIEPFVQGLTALLNPDIQLSFGRGFVNNRANGGLYAFGFEPLERLFAR